MRSNVNKNEIDGINIWRKYKQKELRIWIKENTYMIFITMKK